MCANVAPVARLPRWGIMDNRNAWESILQGGQRLGEFRFANIHHATFEGGRLGEATTLDLIYVYNTIRVRVHRLTSVGVMEVLTLGETLMPYLPDDLFLNQHNSRAGFIYDVYSSLPLTNFAANLGAAGLQAAYVACGVLTATEDMTALGNAYPNTVDGVVTENHRNLDAAVMILKIIAGLRPPPKSVAVSMIAVLCSSLAKKGTMSTKFVEKVQDSIESELNLTITLDADACRVVWNYWKDYVDETNVEAIITRWVPYIPANAMRFRLILQQMADEGLTAFTTVRQAITSFPDFPWGIVEALFPDEAGRYVAAIQLVGNNQYFGYAKDISDAAGTKYRDLAWVSRELMIKLGGQPELKGSKSFTNKPGHRGTLEDLIDTYLNVKGANAVSLANAPSRLLAPAIGIQVPQVVIVPQGTV